MRLVTVVLCLAISPVAAQSDSAVEPDEHFANQHYIGRLQVIRADHTSQDSDPDHAITLEVIVTREGRVEFAHAVKGPVELLSLAEAIEMERRFKPFHKDGKPVKASITDYVIIEPTERWGAKQAFPEVKDWDSLRFTLERPEGMCLSCPAYRLEIRGDGTVMFAGLSVVPPDNHRDEILKTVIPGKYRGKVSRRQVAALLEKFRQADYFSLKDSYAFPATDMETVKTSVTIDGKTKSVTDYGGLEVGMPEVVLSVEDAMDQAAIASFRAPGLNEQAAKLEAALASRN